MKTTKTTLKNKLNNRTLAGVFKSIVSIYCKNSPYYFEASNIRFFGSVVTRCYSDDKNNHFVAFEELRNAPTGTDYKVLYFNAKTNKLTTSGLLTKSDAEKVFKQIRKTNKISLNEYNNLIYNEAL